MIIMPTNKYLNKNLLNKLAIDYLAKHLARTDLQLRNFGKKNIIVIINLSNIFFG